MLYSNKKNNTRFKKTNSGYKYSSKEYSNPFFEKKRKKTNKSFHLFITLKVKILFFVFFVLALAVILVGLFLPYFNITNIELEGQGNNIDPKIIESIINKHLSRKIFIIFNNKNIFLFNSEKLEAELREKYVFQEISIEKKFGSALNVFYIEEKYAIIYEEDGIFYYGDDDGNVIEEVDILEVDQKEYPIIKNLSDKKINNNKVSFDPALVNYAIESFKKFYELRTPDLEFEYFQINAEEGNRFWLKI